jgi:tetratricopeptide (TPR) repeat protein
MFKGLLALGALLAAAPVATTAWADGAVTIAPAGAWVKPVEIPSPPPGEGAGAPARILLQDVQMRFGADGDEAYSETAIKFQTPQGLSAGTLALPWNPDTDSLTVHKVHIIRGAQVIDVLGAGETFTILRRETKLELAMLDGVLTAALQPEGLQVGDVLDVAFTLKHRDPALQGRSQYLTGDLMPLNVDRLHIREVWPTSKPMRWQEMEGLPQPLVTKSADGTELVIDMKDAVRPKTPKDAPPRFENVGLIETSEFADWAAVSAIMAPLYDQAAALKVDSGLPAEIARIKAVSSDPAVQAAAALQLVQDQVRYVYLGINDGGYVPAQADRTWARRFGDCKGKTVLLLALLRGLGIQAEPALVSSHGADGLEGLLPTTLFFDHVLIRATIAGKTYWMDGTRTGDRSLAALDVPAFGWALPVQASGAKLEKLALAAPQQPLTDLRIHLDASAGLDAAAPAHVEFVMRGDAALAMKLNLDAAVATDRDQTLKKYWASQYDWIDVASVGATYDEATGEERLTMDGSAKMAWGASVNGSREYEPDLSRLGWDPDFSRDPGPHQDAPFAVPFPASKRWSETIVLPHAGDGFAVSEPNIDKAIAGRSFTRTGAIDHGVFTMVATTRSLVSEISAADAKAAAPQLKALSLDALYLTAPRWYHATDQELTQRVAKTPADAGGYLDRADAYVSKGDFDHAIADANQAVALKPNDAAMLNARCFTRAEANRDLPAALDDCNAALKLAPRDPPTLDSRGFVYFRLGQFDQSIADYDAALAVDQTLAPSLYIRGLAKLKQGDAKGGDADIAAAKALDPTVADTYARVGVKP